MAHVYKALWTVEDIIRTGKSILETRPIYHKRDATIRGHVFCSFLALLLKQELESRKTTASLLDWDALSQGLAAIADAFKSRLEAAHEIPRHVRDDLLANLGSWPLVLQETARGQTKLNRDYDRRAKEEDGSEDPGT